MAHPFKGAIGDLMVGTIDEGTEVAGLRNPLDIDLAVQGTMGGDGIRQKRRWSITAGLSVVFLCQKKREPCFTAIP